MEISLVIFFFESQLKHYCALNVHLKHFGKASVPTPPHTQTRLFEDNAVIFLACSLTRMNKDSIHQTLNQNLSHLILKFQMEARTKSLEY